MEGLFAFWVGGLLYGRQMDAYNGNGTKGSHRTGSRYFLFRLVLLKLSMVDIFSVLPLVILFGRVFFGTSVKIFVGHNGTLHTQDRFTCLFRGGDVFGNFGQIFSPYRQTIPIRGRNEAFGQEGSTIFGLLNGRFTYVGLVFTIGLSFNGPSNA